MVNFKIYYVTTGLTNNCARHIAQYLTKYGEPHNQTWSTKSERFFFKNHVENEAGALVPYIFYFLKKPNMR